MSQSVPALPAHSFFDDLIVRDLVAAPVTVSTAAPVTLTAQGGWLSNPLDPSVDVPISVDCSIGTACAPVSRTTLVQLDDELFDADGLNLSRVDWPRPTAMWHVRKAFESGMRLFINDRASRNAVEALFASGAPLLLRLPAEYEWDDAYLAMGSLTRERLAVDHRRPYRLHRVPFTVVDALLGSAAGPDGARWDEACAVYATWGAATGAAATWQTLAQGV